MSLYIGLYFERWWLPFIPIRSDISLGTIVCQTNTKLDSNINYGRFPNIYFALNFAKKEFTHLFL
jgi:hypothetical protein